MAGNEVLRLLGDQQNVDKDFPLRRRTAKAAPVPPQPRFDRGKRVRRLLIGFVMAWVALVLFMVVGASNPSFWTPVI